MVTGGGVTGQKVLRGFQRFSELFRNKISYSKWSRKWWEVLTTVPPLSVTPLPPLPSFSELCRQFEIFFGVFPRDFRSIGARREHMRTQNQDKPSLHIRWCRCALRLIFSRKSGAKLQKQPNAIKCPETFKELFSERKKAHKHKLFALVNVQMALGQRVGCPRVNRTKKFMCSPRNTGNINSSLWLTGGLSQGCPDFQKVCVFKVYVPFSCPIVSCLKVFHRLFFKVVHPQCQTQSHIKIGRN